MGLLMMAYKWLVIRLNLDPLTLTEHYTDTDEIFSEQTLWREVLFQSEHSSVQPQRAPWRQRPLGIGPASTLLPGHLLRRQPEFCSLPWIEEFQKRSVGDHTFQPIQRRLPDNVFPEEHPQRCDQSGLMWNVLGKEPCHAHQLL